VKYIDQNCSCLYTGNYLKVASSLALDNSGRSSTLKTRAAHQLLTHGFRQPKVKAQNCQHATLQRVWNEEEDALF